MWRSSFFCKTSHQSVFSRTENRSGSVGRTYADDTSRGSPAVFTSSLSLAFLLDCLISVRHIAEVPGEDWRIVVHALLFVVYRAPTARERGNRFLEFSGEAVLQKPLLPSRTQQTPRFSGILCTAFCRNPRHCSLATCKEGEIGRGDALSFIFISLSRAHDGSFVILFFFVQES